MNAWPTDEQALGTDFRHSNSFSFSYQVRDEYQKRPSYVLLSLALCCPELGQHIWENRSEVSIFTTIVIHGFLLFL